MDIAALFEGFAPPIGGSGHTTRELCEILGKSEIWVKNKIREAQKVGVCRPSKKRVPRIDGGTTLVSSYVFEEAGR